MQVAKETFVTQSNPMLHKTTKKFVDRLGNKLGLKKMEDWYGITIKQIVRNGGAELLKRYDNLPSKMLQLAYPQYSWKIWMFKVPKGYWNDKENQREFLDWLGKHLGFQKMEDWYNITSKDVIDNGGIGLILKFADSSKLVQSVYSEHLWMTWRFQRGSIPPSTELSLEKRVEFIKWLAKELLITDDNLDDWYRTSWNHIDRIVSLSQFKQYPLEQLLKEAYPHQSWDIAKLQSKNGKMKASQRILVRMVQEVFSDYGELTQEMV
jgi:hypothetical protein